MKMWGMVMRVQKSDPRRNASSAKQSRGQKVWFHIKSNIPDNSTNEDKYQEGIGQKKAMKYLRESYYHCIKCSAANFLVALMRKWYLNNSFQPYSYTPKTSGRCWCDKDQHRQSNLHVEGIDERSVDTPFCNLHLTSHGG